MQSPLDQKELKLLEGGFQVYGLNDEQWLIKKDTLKSIQSDLKLSPSKEVYLDDLGVFPLENEQLSLLDKQIKNSENNESFVVPQILKQSRIPLFYSTESVLIPQSGLVICQYFGLMWDDAIALPETTSEGFATKLRGLLIINSFVGLV